jgi:hypothetical protein
VVGAASASHQGLLKINGFFFKQKKRFFWFKPGFFGLNQVFGV